MSYIQALNALISTGTNAFLHSWSLTQREIELEFQTYKGFKHLQSILGTHLSLKLNEFFKSNDQILLVRYYDNNELPIFSANNIDSTDYSHLHQSFFVQFLENNPVFKVLLSTFTSKSCQFSSCLLTMRENSMSQIALIEETILSDEVNEVIYMSNTRGNYIICLLECKEEFNFSYIIELLKLWTIFNGHIRFKARYLPFSLIELLTFLPQEQHIAELVSILNNPLTRLSITAETEAQLILVLKPLNYQSESSYYESLEYFMNLQSIQENLISLSAEFDLEENTLSTNQVDISTGSVLNILIGLNLSKIPFESKRSSYIIHACHYNNKPIILIDTNHADFETLLGKEIAELLEKALTALLYKRWSLKVVPDSNNVFSKRKSIAELLEIKPQIPTEASFQIIILSDISSCNSNISVESVREAIKQNYNTLLREISHILEKRLEDIFDTLAKSEIYLTRKMKKPKDVPEYYIPKLIESLSNILSTFSDEIIFETDEFKSPKVKALLEASHGDKEIIQEVLKQGLYKIVMQNNLSKK